MREERPPFFIVGTERSGSNLLRLMLDAHSRLAVPHPPHLMRDLSPLAGRYGDLSDDGNFARLVGDVVRLVDLHFFPWGVALDRERVFRDARARSLFGAKAAAYREYMRSRGKVRWGSKSTHLIHFAGEILREEPGAQFIHLVRDGRDVAVSAKNSVFNRFHPHYVSLLWSREQRLAAALGERLPKSQLMTLLYEDLISAPDASLRRVTSFLGETFEPRMLEYFAGAEARRQAAMSASWENCSSPVLRNNRGQYKTRLSPGEVWAFERNAFEELERFGYPLENDRNALEAARERGIALPERAGFFVSEKLRQFSVGLSALWTDRNALLMVRKKLCLARLRWVR